MLLIKMNMVNHSVSSIIFIFVKFIKKPGYSSGV